MIPVTRPFKSPENEQGFYDLLELLPSEEQEAFILAHNLDDDDPHRGELALQLGSRFADLIVAMQTASVEIAKNVANALSTDTILSLTVQASGALPNGTRIKKIRSVPDDTHKDGDEGVVYGSVNVLGPVYFYYVRWDDMPNLPVGVASFRISTVL